MDSQIFNKLIENIECTSWCLGELSFYSKFDNYELSFGQTKNEYFVLDDAGYTLNNIWITTKLSLKQELKLISIIEEKEKELTNNRHEVEGFEPVDYEHFNNLIYN